MFDNAVSYVHHLLRSTVQRGDVVVDATLGNGWDAALMAGLVGADGALYGFDIQPVAIEVTNVRLREMATPHKLVLAGHETMLSHIDEKHLGKVRAITFNLGYMPGGDKAITTHAHTTEIALKHAVSILAEGGIITIVCYRHTEGVRELELVRNLIAGWDQGACTCTETSFINQQGTPPVVFTVIKRANS